MAGTSGDERGRDRAGDAGDAWHWGLETSRLMGERLLDLYSEVGAAAFSRFARDGGEDLRQVRIDMERWVDLSVELFDRAFAIMQRLGDSGEKGNPPAGRVELAGPPGATCVGDLWVHNVSDAARTTPALRCPGLTSVGGGHIPASQVRFGVDPQPLNGRMSRKVSVVVDIPHSTAPGIYHGQILSDATPDAAVALRMDVGGEPPVDDVGGEPPVDDVGGEPPGDGAKDG